MNTDLDGNRDAGSRAKLAGAGDERTGNGPRRNRRTRCARRVRRALTGRRAGLTVVRCALCAILLAAAAFFLPLLPFFCVSEADASGPLLLPDKPTLCGALKRAGLWQIPETDFVVSYTHSVNKGRVKDFYTFKPDQSLFVTKTRFVSYGAGIPEPEEGNVFTETADYIEIGNLRRRIPRLVMRVGVIADHAIECGDKRYRLTDYFKPQTAVAIEYRNISVFDYMRSLSID